MSRNMRALTAVVAAGAVAVAGVATQAGAATKTVSVRAAKSGALKFNKTRIRISHGKATFVMSNPSGLPHAIAVEGHGIDTKGSTVGKGGTSKVTVTLKKGTYTFYCPVDGHRQAGMQGKVIVS